MSWSRLTPKSAATKSSRCSFRSTNATAHACAARSRACAASSAKLATAERERARQLASSYYALAWRYARAASPALIVVCGLSGSGKSTVARMLQHRKGFKAINSDRVRKRLASVPPHEHVRTDYGANIYSDRFTKITYDAMLAEAEQPAERRPRRDPRRDVQSVCRPAARTRAGCAARRAGALRRMRREPGRSDTPAERARVERGRSVGRDAEDLQAAARRVRADSRDSAAKLPAHRHHSPARTHSSPKSRMRSSLW